MQTITVETLYAHLSALDPQKELIIDVRTPAEFESGHIPGAVNRIVDTIEDAQSELAQYETVYVHCKSGGRSAQACGRLEVIGLKNTVNVEGGAMAWAAAGFELEK